MPSAAPESGSTWRAASKHKCLRTILNKHCRRDNPMPTLDPSVFKNVCRLDFFYLIFIQQDCWTQILSQSVVTGWKFDIDGFVLRLSKLQRWIALSSSVNVNITSSLIRFAWKQRVGCVDSRFTVVLLITVEDKQVQSERPIYFRWQTGRAIPRRYRMTTLLLRQSSNHWTACLMSGVRASYSGIMGIE